MWLQDIIGTSSTALTALCTSPTTYSTTSLTSSFRLFVPDLSPNIGLWWYFFIEIFDHFRDFFLLTFNVHIASYSFPLTIKYRFVEMYVSFYSHISIQTRPAFCRNNAGGPDRRAEELSIAQRYSCIPGIVVPAQRDFTMYVEQPKFACTLTFFRSPTWPFNGAPLHRFHPSNARITSSLAGSRQWECKLFLRNNACVGPGRWSRCS